jgi:hypothetical protein
MFPERASEIAKGYGGTVMIYRLTCPCGAEFKVDERVIGKQFTCVGCQRKIRVEQVNLEQIGVYRFECECGVAFKVEEKAIGGTFQCPKCETTTQISREHLTAVDDDHVSKSSPPSLPVEFLGETSSAP